MLLNLPDLVCRDVFQAGALTLGEHGFEGGLTQSGGVTKAFVALNETRKRILESFHADGDNWWWLTTFASSKLLRRLHTFEVSTVIRKQVILQ
jgi:hypothetical protein